MIQVPYTEQDVQKLNKAIVGVVQALRGLELKSDGQKVTDALQQLQKALNEFPSEILTPDNYMRLTEALHVLTDMRSEEKWSEKLAFEWADIVDPFVKIVFEAAKKHPVFKVVALPDLGILQARAILMRENDVSKQLDLLAEFDPYLEKALDQYEAINEVADKKNAKLAAMAQQMQKAKFTVHGKITEEQAEEAIHFMAEFYAVCAAAAVASEVTAILRVYRQVVLQQIEKKLTDLQKSAPDA